MRRDAPGREPAVELPGGVAVGHWTDRDAWTGCTVIVGPPGSVSAGEVRGGGPGTREFALLSPATATPGAEAIVLSGGSAFGLAAADGVVAWLAEQGRGFPTPAASVPLVAGAVVYDLGVGDASVRPDAAAGRAACEAAGPVFARGSVGAGTGCTAGKLLGASGWTKTGLGAASTRIGGALLTAIAVANPFGDVLAADGSILAGVWRDGAWQRTVDLVRASPIAPPPTGQATTLVCLLTDARLDKTQAWLVARAASAGVARAVSPSATAVDGDLVVCLATGAVPSDPFALSVLAAEVTAEAIRDAACQATGAPGAPTARERMGGDGAP
jgi:L-aminopeptidase/D-esterase-like protein